MPRPRNNETREAILKNAFRRFSTQEYDQIYLKDIAEDCGITKTLLHHYYPQKADIVVHIIYDLLVKIQDEIDQSPDFNDDLDRYSSLACDTIRLHYMFDVLERDGNNLLRMYSSILSDAKLMYSIVGFCLKEMRTYRDNYTTLEEKTGQYILFGGISQLVLLLLDGKLSYSIQEGVSRLTKSVYRDQGMPESEIEDVFRIVNKWNDPVKMDSFYNKYIGSMEHFINCNW